MRFIAVSLTLLAIGSTVCPAQAEVKIDKKTQKRIDQALKWLAKKQNSDGSFSDGRYQHNTAITAFAMLAFMSQGHLPNQGYYGPEVAKAGRFLMAAARSDGYIVGARGGNMYCHNMAALALAELWGSSGDEKLRPIVKKATDLIIRSQNRQGGWRYQPRPADADISVTIMSVMALRAAKNAGLHVPDETLKKAIHYIESCYNKREGGFSYQPGGRGPGFARTAAGACCLFLAGDYKAEQIPKAVKFLQDHFDDRSHFWYGHYYASHAIHQVGGKDWEKWYKRIGEFLAEHQSSDGSWSQGGRNEVGPVYRTSIAVIILSVPTHYLPIFQR